MYWCYFATQTRSWVTRGSELPPRNERASEAERRVARTLLEEMTAPSDIRAFHDTQHEQLEKLLAQRGRGKKVPAPKAPPATNLVDLASVLERSLSAAKNRPKPGAPMPRARLRGNDHDLAKA